VAIALLFIVNIALISAIIGVVHWVGGSAPARLDSAQTARTAFLAEFPDAEITEITLTLPGDGALLALDQGPEIGLVRAMGMHWLVRRLEPGSLAAVTVTGPGRIRLRLADFTAPRVTVDLADEAQSTLWCARLQNLCAAAPRRGAPLKAIQT
jgi:hypothetical protein